MSRVKAVLIVPILAMLLLATAHAAPKAPSGTVKLPSEKLFITESGGTSYICGEIKKWEAGKLVGKNKDYFLPMRVEISQMKKRSASVATEKKIKKLKALQKNGDAACQAGPPAAPQPTPSPTPTSTPTPTPTEAPAVDLFAEKTTPVTSDDLNHLYRHAGLGVPPSEAQAFVGGAVGPLVDYFMTYQDEFQVENEARTWLDENVAEPHFPDSTPSATGINLYALRILMNSRNQFHERLSLLALHDRLATSSRAVDSVAAQRSLMVTHLALLRNSVKNGLDFEQLMEELGEDGVMLRWLTLDKNVQSAPNEDYAREIMELFTLDTVDSKGVPNYTNNDIISVARAFTGWNLLQINGRWSPIFATTNFDPDPNKIIFAGTPWQGSVRTGRDVVRHIFAHHPNAPVSLAKWIAREYLRENTSEPLVAQLSAHVKENNYKLIPVFAKLLKSEEFYKPENQLAIAKTPVERFAHLTRVMSSVGMPYDFRNVRDNLAGMGCVLTQTETVFGCDKLEELPDGQRLLGSANLVTTLSNNNNLFNQQSWNYTRFFPNATPTADQMIASMESRFGVQMSAARKTAIKDYMNFSMNNAGALVAEPWNPANTAMVRRKTAGLFRIFAQAPQNHDLR